MSMKREAAQKRHPHMNCKWSNTIKLVHLFIEFKRSNVGEVYERIIGNLEYCNQYNRFDSLY